MLAHSRMVHSETIPPRTNGSWRAWSSAAPGDNYLYGADAGGPNAVWAVGYRFELNAYSTGR